MGDPFEDAAQQSSASPGALREPSIQQAVTFLNDPRVKGAEPQRALDFLRTKGITEDELREAYRRVGVPFPNSQSPFAAVPQPFAPGAPPMYPPHGVVVPYQRRGPSWMSVFLGITAAAGIYTAIREVLRRYVVPMYFPDAARVAEERRRREEMSFQGQEVQIAELRTRIQELVASTQETNSKVEQLTHSVTSSLAVRERTLSENSELQNAIRQISHSVTASGGTGSRSRGRVANGGEDGDKRFDYLTGSGARKNGSLAYTHVDKFNFRVSGDKGQTAEEGEEEAGEGDAKGDVEGDVEGDADQDEFMAIAPAEVEESWGGEEGKDEGAGWGKRTARQLFQSEVMKEARLAMDGTSTMSESGTDGSKGRGRVVSMPQLEVPLSDEE